MQVQLNEHAFKVRWYYIERTTFCEITNVREDKKVDVLCLTEAHTHPNDNFCRNRGRKISMERALKLFPKEERKPFWEAYKTMRNGKW